MWIVGKSKAYQSQGSDVVEKVCIRDRRTDLVPRNPRFRHVHFCKRRKFPTCWALAPGWLVGKLEHTACKPPGRIALLLTLASRLQDVSKDSLLLTDLFFFFGWVGPYLNNECLVSGAIPAEKKTPLEIGRPEKTDPTESASSPRVLQSHSLKEVKSSAGTAMALVQKIVSKL